MYCILTIISRFSCRFLQLFEKVSLVAYSKYLRRITIIPKHDQFCLYDTYNDLRDILDLLRVSNLNLLSLGMNWRDEYLEKKLSCTPVSISCS